MVCQHEPNVPTVTFHDSLHLQTGASPFSGNHLLPWDRVIDSASLDLYTWTSFGRGSRMSTTQTLSSQLRLCPIRVCPRITGAILELTHTLTVVYRDRTVIVSNPTDFPDIVETSPQVREVQEPIVKANIIVPEGLSAFFKN